MKRIFMLLMLCLMMAGSAFAQEEDSSNNRFIFNLAVAHSFDTAQDGNRIAPQSSFGFGMDWLSQGIVALGLEAAQHDFGATGSLQRIMMNTKVNFFDPQEEEYFLVGFGLGITQPSGALGTIYQPAFANQLTINYGMDLMGLVLDLGYTRFASQPVHKVYGVALEASGHQLSLGISANF